jgi:hypothetical protein
MEIFIGTSPFTLDVAAASLRISNAILSTFVASRWQAAQTSPRALVNAAFSWKNASQLRVSG